MFEDTLKLIGANIRYYRQLKELNQQTFAESVGLSRQYLSKIEHGEASCSLNTLYRIAEVLEVEFKDGYVVVVIKSTNNGAGFYQKTFYFPFKIKLIYYSLNLMNLQ